MSSSTAESRDIPVRTIGVRCALIAASVVIPLLIAGWAIQSAISGKSFGAVSNVNYSFYGAFKDGEFWFPSIRYIGGFWPKSFQLQICRLNLKTGQIQPTSYSVPANYVFPRRVGDKLFATSQTGLFEFTDQALVGVSTLQMTYPTLVSIPFLYEGQLTVVEEPTAGQFRLLHWNDGKWSAGRKVRLPVQQFVPSSGRIARPHHTLNVSSDKENRFHLLYSNGYMGSFHRQGFDFIDEEAVTALSPENDVLPASGWRPVIPRIDVSWDQMDCDKDGPIFVSQSMIVRLSPEGQIQHLRGFEHVTAGPGMALTLCADPAEDETYLISWNHQWSSAQIHRIVGKTIQPAHVFLPGFKAEYLGRWKTLVLGTLGAWLSHLMILFGTAVCLESSNRTYMFGTKTVEVGSLARRCLAFAIDLILAVALLASYGIWTRVLSLLNLLWTSFSGRDLAGILSQIDFVAANGRWNDLTLPVTETVSFVRNAGPSILLMVMALFVMKVFMEANIGRTPGKWLLGLRVVTSTLRRCGWKRALVRNLMLWIDAPLLITPLPAIACALFTTKRQRLGDLVADSMIILDSDVEID